MAQVNTPGPLLRCGNRSRRPKPRGLSQGPQLTAAPGSAPRISPQLKGGIGYGATDELGYHAAEDVVHVRDLHATVLHLLGIDHEKFSVKYQGLDMKLTGVEPARVVKDILT